MFISLTYSDTLALMSVKQIEGHRRESCVKQFNKLWAEMASVDSFLSLILVCSHFFVKKDLASVFLSLCETSLFLFPLLLSSSISLLGSLDQVLW